MVQLMHGVIWIINSFLNDNLVYTHSKNCFKYFSLTPGSKSDPNADSANIDILHVDKYGKMSINSSPTGSLATQSRICWLNIGRCALTLVKFIEGLTRRRWSFHCSAKKVNEFFSINFGLTLSQFNILCSNLCTMKLFCLIFQK